MFPPLSAWIDGLVVRENIDLELERGVNTVRFTDITGARWLNESFEMKPRNHKEESVEVRVVEHLYRWLNWDIIENSDPFIKTESQTMEFHVQLEPNEEKTVTYTVHYTW